jgi:type I restriction enzyme S subunit
MEENMIFQKEVNFQESSIGKIPKDWCVQELGDESVANIIAGQSPPSSTYNRENLGLPFLQGKMEFGEMFPSPTTYCSKPIKAAKKHDILLSVRAPVGDVNIAPFECCIGRGLAAIRAKANNLDYLFLFRYLKHESKRFKALSTGSTFKAIRMQEIERFSIPLPSVKEQKNIVAVLGVVDSAILKVDEVIWKTERLKKGLMQQLLTRGIGHKEYKDTPIGTVPEEWGVYPCSELCKEITVGIVVTPAKYYTASGVPCLRSFNIQENEIISKDLVYISPEANELHKKSIIHTGDVVAVRTGQPGTSSAVPPAFDGANCIDLIIFRPNDMIRPGFLSCFLNSPLAKRQVIAGQTGSVQQHFNIGMAEKLKVVLPPLYEQKKIASMLHLIHGKLKFEIEEKARLERIKRGLMDLLLTGKIRVKVD